MIIKHIFISVILLLPTYLFAQEQLWGTTPSGGSQGGGNIFSINTAGSNFEEKAGFLMDGRTPYGNLLHASDGKYYGMVSLGGNNDSGIIFKMESDGSGYQKLHDFNGTNGRYARDNLIEGADGYLYGTTVNGGNSNRGVIFKINKDGNDFTVLHHFNGSNGKNAYGDLIQASNGKLYGMTRYGGNNDHGVIFRINTDGTGFTIVHHFNDTNGKQTLGSLIQVGDSLFGMTQFGGNNDHGVIFKIDLNSSNFTVLHHFNGTDGSNPQGNLLLGLDDILYGMAKLGGSNDDGVVFKINTNGSGYTLLYEFDGIEGGEPTGSLIQTSNGDLFGSTTIGGEYSRGVIFSLKADGSGYENLYGFYIHGPRGSLVEGNDGDLFGLATYGFTDYDSENGHIFKINKDGTEYTTLHKFGVTQGRMPNCGLTKGTEDDLFGMTYYGGAHQNFYDHGTIYKYSTNENKFTILHEFDSINGGQPVGNLLKASNGKFYGTAESSGTYDHYGMIFSVNNDGSEFTKLHNFNHSDGYSPSGNLLEASDGNIYGITTSGGTSSVGIIYKFDPTTSSYSVIHEFGQDNGKYPFDGLIEIENELFGVTIRSNNGHGVIFKIDISSLQYTVLHEFDGSAGDDPYGNLLFASNQYLYGTTYLGGLYNKGIIYKMKPDGTNFMVIHNFDGTYGERPLTGLIEDANGYLYATTQSGGTFSKGVIYKIKLDGSDFMVIHEFNGENGKHPRTALLLFNPNMTSTGIANVSVDEDAEDFSINLYDVFEDREDTDNELTYTVEQITDSSLFASVLLTASELILDFADDAYGTSEITVRATDTDDMYLETTFTVTVNPLPDVPSVTTATTVYGNMNDGGLVITKHEKDGNEITYFRITDITHGTLYQSDSNTPIHDGDFITAVQGGAGLKFKPISTETGSFKVRASLSGGSIGLGSSYTQAQITVNKATLQVTVSDTSKVYGEENPDFILIYEGFAEGDDVSVLEEFPAASTSATQLSDVGSYPITASGGNDGNYTFNYVDGTFTIEKAILTVKADNQIKTYGEENPLFTVSYEGFMGDDDMNVLDVLPSVNTIAVQFSNAGSYPLTLENGQDENYGFNYVEDSLIIEKAILTVKAENQTKTYGEENPVFILTYEGFVGDDDVKVLDAPPVANTSATQFSNAGFYPIGVTEGVDDNYDFEYVDGTFTIEKAVLTVKPDDQVKTYGEENPAFTISYEGFVGDDDMKILDTQLVASSSVTQFGNAGSYPISVAEGTDNNYTFEYMDGTFIIEKAVLMVKAEDQVKRYGEENPAFKISYEGFVGDDTEDDLDALPSASTSATQLSDAGTYTIFAKGGSSINYDLNYLPGTFTIHKAEATILFNDLLRLYDGEPKEATISTIPEGLVVEVNYNDVQHPPVEVGNYIVTAIINEKNYEGYKTDTLIIEEEIILGLSEKSDEVFLTMYPNPTRGKLVIELNKVNTGKITLQLRDESGKAYFEKMVSATSSIEVDLSSYPKGVYILQVLSSNYHTVRKLILK